MPLPADVVNATVFVFIIHKIYHWCNYLAVLDGIVGLDSFGADARKRSEKLRRATTVSIDDPYASSYPVSWGAEVTAVTDCGEAFKVSRRDCKGDPELALDDDEMRDKAMGLLHYGGLSKSKARQLCDSVLAMPTDNSSSTLFPDLIKHAIG